MREPSQETCPCCALQGGEGEAPSTSQVGWGAREAMSPQGDVSLCPCSPDTAGPSATQELQRLHSAHAVPQAAWKGGAEPADPRMRWQHCTLHLLPRHSQSTHPWPPMRTCHHSPAPLPGSLSFWDKGWVLFLSFLVNFQHRSAVEQSQGGRCTCLTEDPS